MTGGRFELAAARRRSRITAIVAVSILVVTAACSGGDDAKNEDAGGGGGGAADDGPEIVRLAEQQLVRGIQLRLVAATPSTDELSLVLEASSGSMHDAEIALDRARLSADGGEPVEASRSSGRVTLRSGDDRQLEVTFPVADQPESFDLEVPRPFAVADDWEFEDIALDDDPAPDPPGPIALGVRRSHPQGTQLELGTMAFNESRIGMSLVLRNGGTGEVLLITGDDTYLEDDLGNRYLSVLPGPDEPTTGIDAGTEVSGVLSFAGAVDPDATTLSLGLNTGLGGSLDSVVNKPTFLIDDLAIDGSTPPKSTAGLPKPLEIEETIDHRNGVSATLKRVTFDETSIRASVELVNPNDHDVQIQATNVLVDSVATDDLGNEHELLTPDEPETPAIIEVPGGTRLETELAFAGRIADDATSLRIAVNEGTRDAATGRGTPTPTYIWDALVVPERTDAPPAADPAELIVPQHTQIATEALDRSSAEVVARTVDEFDGAETPEGVLLVVPERVLFDFGSHELRADARERLAELAGVLEFYEGAPVDIVGHTDSVGSESSNQKLSERRAAAVADALVGFDIERDRITTSGRGEAEPAAPNTMPDGSDDPAGRQLNRRVEILVRTDEPIPSS